MSEEPSLTDDELVAQFVDASLPKDAFHHAQHLRVAWLFIQRYGMPGALAEFPAALRRFADAKGATTLYHETITWAFLLLINERQQRAPARDWADFVAANGDLLAWKPSVLDQLYTPDTLASDLARRTFVMPDRAVTREVGPTRLPA
jgi:hypothetical protein